MYNKEFLARLDKQRNKITYARITTLNYLEQPLEQVEGRITSGSINIDGNSALRRTFQLSMVADKDYFWGLKTKIKLAIGVANQIDSNYPDIIWFEQGLYVITAFSSAYNTNSYTINISGQDKMCLLNGTLGGSLSSSVDFGQITEEVGVDESGKKLYRTIKYPVKDIIREAVHQYGGEPFSNIIINDLDQSGLELQEYKYDTPMYIWREINDSSYKNGTLDGELKVYINGDSSSVPLNSLTDEHFESLSEDFINPPEKTIVKFEDDNNEYYIAKIDYGETAGYKEIDLVYPDDLIANIGESLTSVLDKIKNFLGEFEYFYNLNGQFIFQKKKTYLNTSWSPIATDEEGNSYVDSTQNQDQYSYIFSDSEFFTALNNTPNIQNIRNDFSVWGSRKSTTTGSKIPIHMRYAIDKKPIKYTSIAVTAEELEDYNNKYNLQVKPQDSTIYFASSGSMFDMPYEVKNNNIILLQGVTSYKYEDSQLLLENIEHTYDEDTQTLSIDLHSYLFYQAIIICDWREIIYQMAKDYRKYNHLDNFELKIIQANQGYYPTGRTGYEQYYIDMEAFWRDLYAPTTEDENSTYTYENCWNTNIVNAPEQLNFWIDFLDTSGELDQFSIPALGVRSKVENDDKVTAIYYKETPNIIFSQTDIAGQQTGYRYFRVPNLDIMFSKSAQGKSAKNAIDTLIYNYSYCAESISITSIPIYYLEPNTRIQISDSKSNISGDYIISKISFPLSYNGTMSITATKAPQRLF